MLLITPIINIIDLMGDNVQEWNGMESDHGLKIQVAVYVATVFVHASIFWWLHNSY